MLETLDLKGALAVATCLRCYATGLTEIDSDDCVATPKIDRGDASADLCPSVYVRCDARAMGSEWHSCEVP